MAASQDSLPKRSRLLWRALWPWLSFAVAFLLFDALFCRLLFWKLPDESAWAEEPHYHFLHKLKQIAPGSPKSPLILVVGSSIAVYSLLPEQIEDYINKNYLQEENRAHPSVPSPEYKADPKKGLPPTTQIPKRHIRVRMLAFQGMTPLHLLVLLPDILRHRPSLILYPVNPVDFRIEKPFVNKNFKSLVSKNKALQKKARASFIRAIANEKEFLSLAPVRTFRLYGKSLPASTNADLLLGGALASWRYRDLAQAALDRLLKNHSSSARHYQNYAGAFVAGISRRGWVAKRFVFYINSYIQETGLHFQARPCLFAQNRRPALRYRFCRPKRQVTPPALPWPIEKDSLASDKALALRLYASEQGFSCSAWNSYDLQRGWQRLTFGEKTIHGIAPQKSLGKDMFQNEGEAAEPSENANNANETKSQKNIYFEGRIADACFDEFSADLRSLRFPRNFGLDTPRIRAREGREIRREDLLYFRYTKEEYKKSYQKRILNFGRAGAAYLAALHDAKIRLAKEPFRHALPSFAAFGKIRKKVHENHIKFLSWSSPENPLSLSLYEGSAWHQGFERFIEKDTPPALRRRKLQARFRMQDFYDYHHMTYFGAKKMSKILQKILLLVERQQLDALGR